MRAELQRARQTRALTSLVTAGTAFLSFISPPNKPVPPDGLRFLASTPAESVSSSIHSVQCPVSITAPTTIQAIQVELTCYSAVQGHFGPQSRNSGLLVDSPEMTLARYRWRYHLSRGGGSPGLFFVYYGRDETGGTGQGPAPKALDGWDKLPVRKYPLPKAEAPADPVYIFPAPGRAVSAAGVLPGAMPGQVPPPQGQQQRPPGQPGQQQQQQQQGQPGMMGTPNRFPGAPYGVPGMQGTPQNQAQAQAYYRQQQLAALQMQQAQGGGGMDPRQYQQMIAQQQQAAMAYQAAQQQQSSPGGHGPDGPPQQQQQNPAYAAQLAQYQQVQQQQVQQQQAALAAQQAQQQAQQKAILAQQQARAAASRAPPPPPSTNAAARPPIAQAPGPPPSAAIPEDDPDVLDLLTARQLAIARYAKQHDLLFGLLGEPWTVKEVVEGKKRKGDSALSSALQGESIGRLEELAISAGRREGENEAAGEKKDDSMLDDAASGKPLSLEERRAELLKMQQETEKEIEEMKARFEKQKASLQARPSVQVA